MGDVRFERMFDEWRREPDMIARLAQLGDDDAVAALAGAVRTQADDPYLINLLATEVSNRLRRFATIVDAAGEGLASCDENGIITYANPAACRMLGYSPGALDGVSFHDLVKEGLRPTRAHEFHTSLELGVASRQEGQLFGRNDGSPIGVDVCTAPILRDGDANGMVVAFSDATERIAQQEALRMNEERYRLLVREVADHAIFMLDPTGRVATWNEGAERITGYPKHEAIGMNLFEFYTSDDGQARLPEETLRLARANGHHHLETWLVRKDGSEFWANVSLSRIQDDGGMFLGFANVVHDLTERRLAEEALREIHQTLDDVIYYSPTPMLAFDAEGIITIWNRAAEEAYGWTREDIVGHKLPIIPPEKEEEFRLELATLQRGERLQGIQTLHRRRDGMLVRVRVNLSPLMDKTNERLLRVVGTIEAATPYDADP